MDFAGRGLIVALGAAGSRCQHMFINPECPRSAYGMAYNCVASSDNSMTFNDGYHILHHLNSSTHWSELPSRFMKLLEQHAESKGMLQPAVSQYCKAGILPMSNTYSYCDIYCRAGPHAEILIRPDCGQLHCQGRGLDRLQSTSPKELRNIPHSHVCFAI